MPSWHAPARAYSMIAAPDSVAEYPLNRFRIFVGAETINDGGAGLVQVQNVDLNTFASQFDHHFVQGGDGGDVPEVRAGQVDGDLADGVLEIKGGDEFVGRAEEHLPNHLTTTLAALPLPFS